jgi:hypothetical protein
VTLTSPRAPSDAPCPVHLVQVHRHLSVSPRISKGLGRYPIPVILLTRLGVDADPIGVQYAFEKRVSKAAGGDGFADGLRRTS